MIGEIISTTIINTRDCDSVDNCLALISCPSFLHSGQSTLPHLLILGWTMWPVLANESLGTPPKEKLLCPCAFQFGSGASALLWEKNMLGSQWPKEETWSWPELDLWPGPWITSLKPSLVPSGCSQPADLWVITRCLLF